MPIFAWWKAEQVSSMNSVSKNIMDLLAGRRTVSQISTAVLQLLRHICSSHKLRWHLGMYRINASCRAVGLRAGWLWVMLLMLGAQAPHRPTTFLSFLILFSLSCRHACYNMPPYLMPACWRRSFNPCMWLPLSCPLFT